MSTTTSNQRSPIIVSIDGNIGAGKTTLFNELKRKFVNKEKFVFLDEPVSVWQSITDEEGRNLLELFYEDSKSWSFSLQIAAFISRLAVFKQALDKNPNSILVSERSLNTDRYIFAKMLYEEGKIRNIDYQIYLKWFDIFAKEFPVQKIIYVRTDPENCYSRIKQRSRIGEDLISIDYLKLCHSYHEEMINIYEREKVTIIDGNIEIQVNNNTIDTWIEMSENALYEYMHL
jgi:deoxyadenosine/deoxycytidine kinase